MPRSTTRRSIELPAQLHARLHAAARQAGRPAAWMLVDALNHYLSQSETLPASSERTSPLSSVLVPSDDDTSKAGVENSIQRPG